MFGKSPNIYYSYLLYVFFSNLPYLDDFFIYAFFVFLEYLTYFQLFPRLQIFPSMMRSLEIYCPYIMVFVTCQFNYFNVKCT